MLEGKVQFGWKRRNKNYSKIKLSVKYFFLNFESTSVNLEENLHLEEKYSFEFFVMINHNMNAAFVHTLIGNMDV